MKNNIYNLVKPAEKNGQVFTHRDPAKDEVTQYSCSTFIRKKNILVKGEYDNKHKKERNAMIILFDTESGEIVGGSIVCIKEVINRKRTDIIQKKCVLCRAFRVERPDLHNGIR